MDALETLKQEFFAVVRDRPEERWDAFKAQFDDLVRQVSETALLGLAAEASGLRGLAEARPAEEVKPKELLFGLPTILAWRVAQSWPAPHWASLTRGNPNRLRPAPRRSSICTRRSGLSRVPIPFSGVRRAPLALEVPNYIQGLRRGMAHVMSLQPCHTLAQCTERRIILAPDGPESPNSGREGQASIQ